MTATLGNLVSGDPAGSVTTITVTMPSASVGTKIGVLLEINGGSGTTITPPAEFTFKWRISNDTTGVISMAYYERLTTGTEAATYDWTLGTASANTSWQSFTISNCDLSSTYNPSSPTTNSGNNSTLELTMTGFNTGVDDELVVAMFAAGTSTYTPSTPAGYSVFGADHIGRGWGIFYKTQTTAGAVADCTSSLGTTNRYWVSAGMGIAPPAVGQPTARRTQTIPYAANKIQRAGV